MGQAVPLPGEPIKSGSTCVCLWNVLLCGLSEMSPRAFASLLVSVCHSFDFSWGPDRGFLPPCLFCLATHLQKVVEFFVFETSVWPSALVRIFSWIEKLLGRTETQMGSMTANSVSLGRPSRLTAVSKASEKQGKKMCLAQALI